MNEHAVPPAASPRELRWVLLIAFALPLAFALATNHVWEDYYITFRASKNLATGHGLVFQWGERLHTFTSPLGVLLPALLVWITRSDDAALWVFRLLSCGALAGGAVILFRTLAEHGASVATRWVVFALFIVEPKVLDFTINGMESAFMVLFGALLVRAALEAPVPRAWPLGAAMAGMLWTRPDGFVPGLAVIFAVLLFAGHRRDAPFADKARSLLKAAAWTTLLYGPWILCAWWYYGTPVPHTITAKAGLSPVIHFPQFLLTAPLTYASSPTAMDCLFSPSYFYYGGWHHYVLRITHVAAVAAGFLWLVPAGPWLGRVASFAVLLGSYYLQAIPPYPWYFPIWTLLAAVSVGYGATTWLAAMAPGSIARSTGRVVFAVLLACQFSVVGLVAWQARQQQRIIEDQGLRPIGQWLAAHGRADETVFLEPLGYIGYYSGMHMLDHPGMSAPKVVAARREVGNNFAKIIELLRPDWLVLRPVELAAEGFQHSSVLNEYRIAHVSDVRLQLAEVGFLPGRDYLENDAMFVIYHRRPPP